MKDRNFCSLFLIERRINDSLRASAASVSAIAKAGEGANYIPSVPFSEKRMGDDYAVLSIDPLECPHNVYVDVTVTNASGVCNDDLVKALYDIGPWNTEREYDHYADKHPFEMAKLHKRANDIKKLFFIVKEKDPAPVGMYHWQENPTKFSRRLTLKNLVEIIMGNIILRRQELYSELFEEPTDYDSFGVQTLAIRSRYTLTKLCDAFFDMDTYSKCIVLVEATCLFLRSQNTGVKLFVEDLYCNTFSSILRKSFFRPPPPPLRATTRQHTFLKDVVPLNDVRVVSVGEHIEDFLATNIDVPESFYQDKYPPIMPPPVNSDDDVPEPKRHRRGNGAFSVMDIQEKRISVSGSVSSPFAVYIRRKPIVPSVHNLLLFPVYSPDNQCIAFFLKLKKRGTSIAFSHRAFPHRRPKSFWNMQANGLVALQPCGLLAYKNGPTTDTSREEKEVRELIDDTKRAAAVLLTALAIFYTEVKILGSAAELVLGSDILHAMNAILEQGVSKAWWSTLFPRTFRNDFNDIYFPLKHGRRVPTIFNARVTQDMALNMDFVSTAVDIRRRVTTAAATATEGTNRASLLLKRSTIEDQYKRDFSSRMLLIVDNMSKIVGLLLP